MVRVANNEAKAGGDGFIDQPGWYHVIIDTVTLDEANQYGPQLTVELSCVGPPNSPYVGKGKKEWLPITGTTVGKLWRFGIATGLVLGDGRAMTDELYKQVCGNGKDIVGTQEEVDIPEQDAVGRQCCVKVSIYKEKPSIGFDWYAIGDPRAKDCQLDPTYAAQVPGGAYQRHLANQKAGSAPGAGGAARPGQGAANGAANPGQRQASPAQGQQRQAAPQQQRQAAPAQTAAAGVGAGGAKKGWGGVG